MLVNLLTILAVGVIVGGGSLYAFRRVTKVWRADRERAKANEAALLAELSDLRAAKRRRPSDPAPPGGSPRPEHAEAVATRPTPAAPPSIPAGPVSVQEEIRAFLGQSIPPSPGGDTGREPATATTDDGGLPGRFEVAVHNLAAALRETAAIVERHAAAPGTAQERAARTLAAVTEALDALPLSELGAPPDPPTT